MKEIVALLLILSCLCTTVHAEDAAVSKDTLPAASTKIPPPPQLPSLPEVKSKQDETNDAKDLEPAENNEIQNPATNKAPLAESKISKLEEKQVKEKEAKPDEKFKNEETPPKTDVKAEEKSNEMKKHEETDSQPEEYIKKEEKPKEVPEQAQPEPHDKQKNHPAKQSQHATPKKIDENHGDENGVKANNDDGEMTPREKHYNPKGDPVNSVFIGLIVTIAVVLTLVFAAMGCHKIRQRNRYNELH